MKNHQRFTLLTTALLLALIFSSFQTILVRADDTLPPPPATEEVVDPATDASVQPPVEELVEQEPAATEPAVVDELLVVEEPTATEPSMIVGEPATAEALVVSAEPEEEEADGVGEILEQLPDETAVIVLDEAGEALPLATQDAANVITSSDPMWCPTGQTPGGAGCTPAFATVTELIAVLGSYSGAGTIYFTETYSDNDATFDHTNVNLANLTDLTIQGGWNGLTDAGYALAGATTFSAPLTVTNWTGNVTLNDLNIGGSNFIGVDVGTSGDIELNDVDASNNSMSSMLGTMGTGANLNAGSDIRVTNSMFNGNGGIGLTAYSDGSITLTDVVVSDNTGSLFGMTIGQGAYLEAGGDIRLTNSMFNNNGGIGLTANSEGSITLINVEASQNTSDIDGFGDGAALLAVDNISITGSTFRNNGADGIDAFSDSAINLSGVIAEENGNRGAYLDNTAGIGSITVTASQFNNNGLGAIEEEVDGDGLVTMSNGNITLLDVIANGNYNTGAYLDTQWNDATGNISIEASQFNENGGGIWAYSSGNISLTDVIASYNRRDGAFLDNCSWDYGIDKCTGKGHILISNSSFDSNTSSGQDVGLLIGTVGNVNLNNVSASMNAAGDGADIHIYSGSLNIFNSTLSSISIQNSTFNNNYSTWPGFGWGLWIQVLGDSSGDISLFNVNASQNRSDGQSGGVSMGIGGNIFVNHSTFSNNHGNGLDAYAGDNMILTDVIANGNSLNGAYLYSLGDTTITCSQLNNNAGFGIDSELDGDTLTLNGNTFANNELGDTYLEGGTLVDNPDYICNPVLSGSPAQSKKNSLTNNGLPLNTIHVSGGEQTALSCNGFSGTELVLPNGDRVILPCPNGDKASLAPLTSAQLPGALDGNFTFISGLDAGVEPSLLGKMIVKFIIPEDQQSANFTILHWNGEKWEDLGGYNASDSFFRVDTQSLGIFVLVRK